MIRSSLPLLLALAALTAAPRAADAQPAWVYHYDPDASARNPGKFKAVLSAFLGTVDQQLGFQPFRSDEDLERWLKARPPSFMIVSAAWYQANRERLSLRPLLWPTRRGQRTFSRVLVTRHPDLRASTLTAASLSGHSVAATSLNDRASFKRTFGHLSLARGQLRVVQVSKDVDALLALALGSVDMALVRPASIARVGRANPNATKGLRTLLTTAPVPFAPLVALGGATTGSSQALIRGWLEAAKSPLGRRALRALGIDGWAKPEGGTP